MRQGFYFDPLQNADMVFSNEWMPIHNARALGKRWLVTTRAGAWMLLDGDAMAALNSVALPANLFRPLVEEGIVLTEANGGDIARQHRRWTEPHVRHPVHHIIVSTLRCNLSCSYCHAPVVPATAGPAYDLPIAVAERILEFASQSKAAVQSFEFQGGESLLNRETLFHMIPRIRERYRALDREVYISIQTNGVALTDATVAFLREHKVKIGTSYDGSDELHDTNRLTNAGAPTAARVRDKIERYKLPFLPTVARQGVEGWRTVIDAQLVAGSTNVAFQPVYPINSAKANWEEVGVEEDRFLAVYRECADYLRSLWESGFYPLERRLVLALRKLFAARDVDYADFGNPCGMVHSQILYDFNGDIYTCDEGRDFPEFKLGNVANSLYEDIVFGAKTRTLKSLSLPNDEECGSCALRPYCSTCPVYTRARDGSLSARAAGTGKCLHTKLIFDLLLSWIGEDPALMKKVANYHGIEINRAGPCTVDLASRD